MRKLVWLAMAALALPACAQVFNAEEIARAAQQFGQEDDITVLSLTFAPAAVASA